MRCENKTFLQNDPGFLQEISSTAVEVGLGYTSPSLANPLLTRLPPSSLTVIRKLRLVVSQLKYYRGLLWTFGTTYQSGLALEGTRLRHRKAMGRSTSHNDGGEARDAAFLRRSSAPPWCSSSLPSCQRGFQLNVNLEQELFGPAASASAVGTCSVTFGSFVLMS